MVCGKNTTNDAYIQTNFRGGCPTAAAGKEKFTNAGGPGLVMNQLNSAFKPASTVAPSSAAGRIEGFALVPGHNSLDVTNDFTGTYGLPWAPY